MDDAMRSDEPGNSAALLMGLLLGGLAGFSAMLLFAPQSGRKTRAQIRQTSSALQDRTTDTFDDLVTLSRFDHRKILSGRRETTENG